jgi:hypothetical protein
MDGNDESLEYMQYRLYGAHRVGTVDLAVDLITVSYDENISGEDDYDSAAFIATYDVTPSLRVGADVEYLTRPAFDNDFRVMAKIVYGFGFTMGGNTR